MREAMVKGPLGFQVVDCAVTPDRRQLSQCRQLRASVPPCGADRDAGGAGRRPAASARADAQADRRLPVDATSRITSAIAGRRGQMLGMAPRDGWTGWDRVEALLPRPSCQGWRPSCARRARAWRPTRPSSTISPSSTGRLPTASSSNAFRNRPRPSPPRVRRAVRDRAARPRLRAPRRCTAEPPTPVRRRQSVRRWSDHRAGRIWPSRERRSRPVA